MLCWLMLEGNEEHGQMQMMMGMEIAIGWRDQWHLVQWHNTLFRSCYATAQGASDHFLLAYHQCWGSHAARQFSKAFRSNLDQLNVPPHALGLS